MTLNASTLLRQPRSKDKIDLSKHNMIYWRDEIYTALRILLLTEVIKKRKEINSIDYQVRMSEIYSQPAKNQSRM